MWFGPQSCLFICVYRTNKPGDLHLAQTKQYPSPPPSLHCFPPHRISSWPSASQAQSSHQYALFTAAKLPASLLRMFPSSFFFVLEACVWFLNLPTSPRLIPPSPWLALDMTVFHLPVYRTSEMERAFAICSYVQSHCSPPIPFHRKLS